LPKYILWVTSGHCDVTGPKATEFVEITQNNGNYAVQGHQISDTNRKPYAFWAGEQEGQKVKEAALPHRAQHVRRA